MLSCEKFSSVCGSVSSPSLENCAFHADPGKLEIPLEHQQIFAAVGIATLHTHKHTSKVDVAIVEERSRRGRLLAQETTSRQRYPTDQVRARASHSRKKARVASDADDSENKATALHRIGRFSVLETKRKWNEILLHTPTWRKMGCQSRSNGGKILRYWSSIIQEYQCIESWNLDKRKITETPYTSMRMLQTPSSCSGSFIL